MGCIVFGVFETHEHAVPSIFFFEDVARDTLFMTVAMNILVISTY